MEFTAKQISDLLQGKVEGDETVRVNRLDKIEAGSTGGLTFLANPKYAPYIYTTNASVIIVRSEEHTSELQSPC